MANVKVAPYAANHGRGNKAVLTNVKARSGESHCRALPDFTDHRPKSNEFAFFRPYSSVLLVL